MSSSTTASALRIQPLQNQNFPEQAGGEPPMQDLYQYESLPSHEYFRILELLPQKATTGGETGVHCRMHTGPFAGAEDKYAAISYVWGDPTETVPIVCDGKIIEVTVNLADALSHIRDYTEYGSVWADAICINQKDDTEKGHQVKRMGRVYENAAEVLVWLGKDDEGIAEDCFNLIRETNEYLDSQYVAYGGVHNMPTITPSTPISFDMLRWDKVKGLMNLPWFRRLWVLQEVALAKQSRLLWGEDQLNLAEIYEISSFITWRGDLANLLVLLPIGFLVDCFTSQCSYRTTETWMETKPFIKAILRDCQLKGTNFLGILDTGRLLRASFRIDRVYGFLASPSARKHGEETLLIEPDYAKSMQQVYFELACELLAHPREGPHLLTYVDHHDSVCLEGITYEKDDDVLPSWVPRWDKGRHRHTFSLPYYWYQAGGSGNFEAVVQSDRSLLLPGIIFDRVLWTSDRLDYPGDWDKKMKTPTQPFIERLFAQAQQALSEHFPKLIASMDDFSLTMAQGRPSQLNYSLQKHQAEYSAYIQSARRLVGPEPSPSNKKVHPWFRKRLTTLRQKIERPQREVFEPALGDTNPYIYRKLLVPVFNRRFAITESGRFGLVSLLTLPDDVCCIFPGMKVPTILAPREDGRYGFVGDSYIHGVMGGEVWKEHLEKEEMKLDDIVLV